jgi:hypothetical protein
MSILTSEASAPGRQPNQPKPSLAGGVGGGRLAPTPLVMRAASQDLYTYTPLPTFRVCSFPAMEWFHGGVILKHPSTGAK